jgi:hypothetical protein
VENQWIYIKTAVKEAALEAIGTKKNTAGGKA